MQNSMIWYFDTLRNDPNKLFTVTIKVIKILTMLPLLCFISMWLIYYVTHPSTLFLSGNHHFVLCFCESVSVLLCLFFCFDFLISCIHKDAKAETPVLWLPHAKRWLIGKYSDAGRDWGQKEKGTTEDEMTGWHHWLDGSEFEWTPGVGDGQGGLVCCDSWGCKESDMTERLNWSDT